MEIKKPYCDSRVMIEYYSTVTATIVLETSYIVFLTRHYLKMRRGDYDL